MRDSKRFDKVIKFNLSREWQRHYILSVDTRDLSLADDVDLWKIPSITKGIGGFSLARLVSGLRRWMVGSGSHGDYCGWP